MSESILQEAERIINGDRAATYGDAGDSFRDIASRWTVELGEKLSEPLTAFDVAHLMIQMKLSRAKNGFHRDSYVDISGYAGLTEKLDNSPLRPKEPRVWDEIYDIPQGVLTKESPGPMYARRSSDGKIWVTSDEDHIAGWIHLPSDHRTFGRMVEVLA